MYGVQYGAKIKSLVQSFPDKNFGCHVIRRKKINIHECLMNKISALILPYEITLYIEYYMGVSIPYPISTRDTHIDPRALARGSDMGRGLIWGMVWKTSYHILFIIYFNFEGCYVYVMEKPISFYHTFETFSLNKFSFSQNVKAMPMKNLGKYSCQYYHVAIHIWLDLCFIKTLDVNQLFWWKYL